MGVKYVQAGVLLSIKILTFVVGCEKNWSAGFDYGGTLTRRAEQRTDAQDKILSAAAKCFAEKGYSGCTLQEIAQRAGMSKGAIYVYYKSKEELFKAMICIEYAQGLKLSASVLEQGTHLNGIIWFMSECIRNPAFPLDHRLWAEILAVVARDKNIRATWHESDPQMRSAFVEMLQKAQEAGEIDPDIDLKGTAIWLTGLGDGLMIRVADDPDFDFSEHLPLFEKLVRRALRP